MKAALVLQGGPAGVDGAKAKAWGITRLFWEARDPNATTQLLKDVRAAGIGVGLMRDPSWNGATAAGLAAFMSQDLSDRGYNSSTGPDSCAAMFDNETHGSAYALEVLRSWRALRATRTTLWTLESGQAGWMEPDLVNYINSDPNLMVVPQIYLGSPRMYPGSERWACDDLRRRGIQENRIVAFYDGERTIPYGWNGIIYDFTVLAAKPPIAL